jgi:hypothetical protein
MWKVLNSGMRDELHATIDYPNYIKPTHVLRSIQLVCHQWFAHKRAHLHPPAPDFTIILNQIMLQVYLLPCLPPPCINSPIHANRNHKVTLCYQASLPQVPHPAAPEAMRLPFQA